MSSAPVGAVDDVTAFDEYGFIDGAAPPFFVPVLTVPVAYAAAAAYLTELLEAGFVPLLAPEDGTTCFTTSFSFAWGLFFDDCSSDEGWTSTLLVAA